MTVKRLLKGDRPWIGALIVIDIILLLLAKSYYRSVNELSSSAVSRSPVSMDNSSIQELRRLAEKGSWEDFENARLEDVAHYLQNNTRPSLADALYFFPETLTEHSLEKEFALGELKPKIDALRQANKARRTRAVDQAYQQLKSKVMNYELGASEDASALSEEARTFLNLYHKFTKLTQ